MPVLLFLGLGGCGADPVVPESLCRGVPGRLFADATGKTALSDNVTGDARRLPLGGPDKRVRLSCNVFSDDKVVAWFDAEVSSDPSEYKGLQRTLEASHGQWDFEVGGGRGRVDEQSKDFKTGIEARWLCGRTILAVGVKKFASDDKAGLTRQLTERIAERVGCTKP